MTMYCTRVVMIILFFLITCGLYAQEDFISFWQPAISLNLKSDSNYSQNYTVSSRNYIYRTNDYQIKVRQIDLSHFSNLLIQDNQSIGMGVQYRIRKTFEKNSGNELRFTQQYNIRFKPQSIRWGMRWRSEQRILSSFNIFRFRYRLAADFPLKGEELNQREPYFIANAESLLSLQKNSGPQYDQRIGVALGYLFSETTKVQFGLEYRFEDYSNATNDLLFFYTSMIFSL